MAEVDLLPGAEDSAAQMKASAAKHAGLVNEQLNKLRGPVVLGGDPVSQQLAELIDMTRVVVPVLEEMFGATKDSGAAGAESVTDSFKTDARVAPTVRI